MFKHSYSNIDSIQSTINIVSSGALSEWQNLFVNSMPTFPETFEEAISNSDNHGGHPISFEDLLKACSRVESEIEWDYDMLNHNASSFSATKYPQSILIVDTAFDFPKFSPPHFEAHLASFLKLCHRSRTTVVWLSGAEENTNYHSNLFQQYGAVISTFSVQQSSLLLYTSQTSSGCIEEERKEGNPHITDTTPVTHPINYPNAAFKYLDHQIDRNQTHIYYYSFPTLFLSLDDKSFDKETASWDIGEGDSYLQGPAYILPCPPYNLGTCNHLDEILEKRSALLQFRLYVVCAQFISTIRSRNTQLPPSKEQSMSLKEERMRTLDDLFLEAESEEERSAIISESGNISLLVQKVLSDLKQLLQDWSHRAGSFCIRQFLSEIRSLSREFEKLSENRISFRNILLEFQESDISVLLESRVHQFVNYHSLLSYNLLEFLYKLAYYLKHLIYLHYSIILFPKRTPRN